MPYVCVRPRTSPQLLGGSVSLSSGASFLVEELCGRTLSHAIYDGACVRVKDPLVALTLGPLARMLCHCFHGRLHTGVL